MSSSIPLQIAETIQTAHINRAPDAAHDLNPSTAASSKQPVTVSHHVPSSDSSHELDLYDEAGIDEDEDTEDIPYDVIRPLPRKLSMPPLPDLRFEQSYLASIAGAETKSRIAYITIRDQVRSDIPTSRS
jgi:Autophagy receptor ATG43